MTATGINWGLGGCTKLYSDLVRFDVFITQSLGVSFLPDTVREFMFRREIGLSFL